MRPLKVCQKTFGNMPFPLSMNLTHYFEVMTTSSRCGRSVEGLSKCIFTMPFPLYMNLTHYFEATTTSSRGGRPDLSGQNSVVSPRGPGNGQMTIPCAAGKRRSDDSVSILLDTDDDCPFKSTAIKKKHSDADALIERGLNGSNNKDDKEEEEVDHREYNNEYYQDSDGHVQRYSDCSDGEYGMDSDEEEMF